MTGARSRLKRLMERYGQSVTVRLPGQDEPLERKAFLQPLRKNREELPFSPTPLGAVSRQRWLYIGRGGEPLVPGGTVSWQGRTLAVQEVQLIPFASEPLYCRAILQPEREEVAV